MDYTLFSAGITAPVLAYEVVAGAGATMNIILGSGAAKVDIALVQGDISGQGNYLVRFDEASKTIALDAADPSDPRIDEVYLVVYDDIYDSTSRSLPRFAVRKGDPAASPALPGPDAAWESFLLLAEVTIPAAAADILAATIVDKRVYAALLIQGGGTAGDIKMTGRTSAPSGWQICDGTAISRTSFKRLFDAIGTAYGVGDGSTTFNIPDMRQRFPLGKADSGTGVNLGDSGGQIDHVHTGPSHSHTMPTHTHASGGYGTVSTGSHDHGGTTNNRTVSHTHQLVYKSAGASDTFHGSSQHDTSVKRHFTDGAGLNDGEDTNSGTTTSHDHVIPNQGNHSHGVTGTSAATDPGDTNSAGTGNTGTKNPPFLTVLFVIKL